jgi:hypothetical protein
MTTAQSRFEILARGTSVVRLPAGCAPAHVAVAVVLLLALLIALLLLLLLLLLLILLLYIEWGVATRPRPARGRIVMVSGGGHLN